MYILIFLVIEHIVIIPAEGNGMRHIPQPRIAETNGSSNALERELVVNSWKEIATYMGRGVRIVQRWERELGLPVRRPRRKSRSAVIALAADLDENGCIALRSAWTGATRQPCQSSRHSSAPDEITSLIEKKQKARTAFGSLSD